MGAGIVFVSEIWYEATLERIETAVKGAANDNERRLRLDEVASWIQTTPPGVADCIRSAVTNATQEGTPLTQGEERRLLKALGEG